MTPEVLLPVELDLRSDAVTRPTEEMWQAMRSAELGWAPVGEDPQVRQLEARVADLVRTDRALLVPTGTMANLLALMTHTQRGDQIVLPERAHILWSEEWGLGYVCGLIPRALEAEDGGLEPEALHEAMTDERAAHRPTTSLVCIENTHTFAGGTAVSAARVVAACEVAHANGAAVHVDGSRIFNAATALGVPVRELVRHADSVAVGLNKALSVPGGALLCGSAAFVDVARVHAKRLGGSSWHQAGITAAAALVALDSILPGIQRDHNHASQLARELGAVPGLTPNVPQTNIVMAGIDAEVTTAPGVRDDLRSRGIGALVYADTVLRFVTHRHVSGRSVETVVEAVQDHMQRAATA